MKLPRDLSGRRLAAALSPWGYRVTRQSGSHLRLTTPTPQQHHLTIPDHPELRVGTLSAIVNAVAVHAQISRQEMLEILLKSL